MPTTDDMMINEQEKEKLVFLGCRAVVAMIAVVHRGQDGSVELDIRQFQLRSPHYNPLLFVFVPAKKDLRR